MKKKSVFITAVLSLILASCASVKVDRVDADKVTDISGYWNDTDVRIVCDALIDDCVNAPNVSRFSTTHGRLPVFIVGTFRNDSSEHIDTSIIVKKMQSVIINSGKAEFVADRTSRKEIRDERDDQNKGNTSEETAKAFGNETGADFLLQGSVKSIVQTVGKKTVRTYHVSAELINIETNKILWSGFNDSIKKVIKTRKVKL